MKKMMILAMMMVMTISANAMSYNAAKNEALFLSDKMAYELNLTAAQYEAVYEINLDYLLSVNGHNDVFGVWWDRRNADLRFVLNAWQYDKYMSCAYFYRPVAWNAGGWSFGIYSHYDRNRFYNARPTGYASYKGGNNRRPDRFYADRWESRHDQRGPQPQRPNGPGPRPHDDFARGHQGNARPVPPPQPQGRPQDNRQMDRRPNGNSQNNVIRVGRR